MSILYKFLSFSSAALIGFKVNPFVAVFFAIFISLFFNFKAAKEKLLASFDIRKYPIDLKKNVIEFLSLLALAVFVSPDILHSLKAFFQIVTLYFIAIVIFRNVTASSDIKRHFYIGFLFALIFGVSICLFGTNSNYGGKIIFALIPIFVSMVANKDAIFHARWKQIVMILIAYFSIFIIAFNNHSATTKFSLLTLPFVFLFFYFFPRQYLKKFLLFISGFIISLVIAAVFFLDSSWVFQKVPNMHLTFKHRICILEASMKKIVENPITGNGLRSSKFYKSEDVCVMYTKEEYREFWLRETGVLRDDLQGLTIYKRPEFHQHNFIIQILFELGIFGILLLFLLIRRLISGISEDRFMSTAQVCLAWSIFSVYIFAYSIWEVHIFCTLFMASLLFKRGR